MLKSSRHDLCLSKKEISQQGRECYQRQYFSLGSVMQLLPRMTHFHTLRPANILDTKPVNRQFICFSALKPSFYKYILLLHTILSLTILDNIVGRPACIKTLISLTYRAAPINYLLKSPQRWLDPPKRHPASLPFMQLILHNELGGAEKSSVAGIGTVCSDLPVKVIVGSKRFYIGRNYCMI